MKQKMGVTVFVKVAVQAKENRVIFCSQELVRVRVKAEPIEGKANSALQKILAEHFGILASDVYICAGKKSCLKEVFLSGLSREQFATFFSPQ